MATARSALAGRADGGLDRRALGAALLELGEARIAAMDAAGIDVSVLSLTTPGVQSLGADEAVRLQTQANDLLAETASEVVGIDRILMSTDYPFADPDPAALHSFLAEAPLLDTDRAKVAGGNWDRLVAGIVR